MSSGNTQGNSQTGRLSQMSTVLGESALSLLDLHGVEYVNELNQFTVRAVGLHPVNLDDLLGTEMEVEVEIDPTVRRYFRQVVASARCLNSEENNYVYEFQLRPWLWLLGHRVNSRIFKDISVIDIILQVCNEALGRGGDIDVQTSLGADVQEYVVQYNESDLTFVRRLLEECGINFHFLMEKGREQLVLSDEADSFPMALISDVHYSPQDTAGIVKRQTFQTMGDERQITPGSFRTTDYNFKTPSASMEASQTKAGNYNASSFEVYRYPGGYLDGGGGQTVSKRRMKALKTQEALVRASGYAPGLAAGSRTTVSDAADSAANGIYAVLEARHDYSPHSYRSGSGSVSSDGRGYNGQYVLTKASNPIAPMQVTERPRVMGPQTAIVVQGPEDNPDPYNRVKVQFYWDTSASSMFCRVAHLWAGNSWGSVFVPRVGMEVVVDFLHGDVNYPIITGCVYNQNNLPPWQVTNEYSVSGIKTEIMGGSGYNEFSFDDKAGDEKVRIHAQKDYISNIENDSTKTVGGNFKTDITGTRTVTVTQASKLTSQDSITIEATNQIQLIVGSSKITLSQQGVTIEGVNVEATATAQLKTTGLTAQHGASVDLSIQSAIVRINS